MTGSLKARFARLIQSAFTFEFSFTQAKEKARGTLIVTSNRTFRDQSLYSTPTDFNLPDCLVRSRSHRSQVQ